MNTDKAIAALNNLIEINNDRVEGYETASKETDSTDLKSLFSALAATSQQNLGALRAEVAMLGGTPEDGTRVSGKFFRAWMDVKAALTSNNRHEILSSCEFGEDKALEAYESVLEDNHSGLSADQLSLVREQKTSLRKDHDQIRSLRDLVA
jgi:uncharacterized protein (TIGR02284 family)